MILEGILNAIKAVIIWFFNLLPSPNIQIESNSIVNGFLQIIEGIAYIAPIGDILIMLGIWFGLYTFFIGWKAIQRVWDALPFI